MYTVNHSGKYIEINSNMKIPFTSFRAGVRGHSFFGGEQVFESYL